MNDQLKKKFRKILQNRLNRMGRNAEGLKDFLERHDLKMRWRLDNLQGIANWYDENGNLPPRDTSTTIVVGIYGPATWHSNIRRMFPDSVVVRMVPLRRLPPIKNFTGILVSKETVMRALILGDIP